MIRTKAVETAVEQSGRTIRALAQAPASVHPILQLQRAAGNQTVRRLLQGQIPRRKLIVSQPGDRYEREADRIADGVMHSTPRLPQRAGFGRFRAVEGIRGEFEDEQKQVIRTKQVSQQILDLPADVDTCFRAMESGGEPLADSARAYFGPRLGHDFSQVRIHTDTSAAQSAQALNAQAYTMGRHIVFGARRFEPETLQGRRLLAHELVHTIQQQTNNHGPVPAFLQRQEEHERGPTPSFGLPPLTLPWGGLTLIPGPLGPSLPGTRIPLPADLRITNAFGMGPGPTFVVDLAPRLLVANILENIDLHTWTRPGTPLGAEREPASQARISLLHPMITLNPVTGRIVGRAILSVGSDYPPAYKGPTEIDVDVTSEELGQFTGQLGYGPLHADFSLRLHYNTDRLEQALRPVLTPEGGLTGLWGRFQGILQETVPRLNLGTVSSALQTLLRSVTSGELQVAEFVTRTIVLVGESVPAGTSVEGLRTALTQFGTEITHAGFALGGHVRLGPLPITAFRAKAPTTIPLARPLLGAPTTFPSSYIAGGVIIAPPGSLASVPVPALGITGSSFGETHGISGTAALLPTLSLSAISAHEPLVREFPVYAYAEVSYLRRVATTLDLGLRLTVQVSTPELFGGPEGPISDPAERMQHMLQHYGEARQPGGPPPVVPNVGLTLFGRFSGL